MDRRYKIYKIILISGLVLLISILHYVTQINEAFYHLFYLDLYFFPLVLASIWFGLKGAIYTSLAISIIYLPLIGIKWEAFSMDILDQLIEVGLFYLLSIILGFLTDREKANQKTLQESKTLAALGEMVSGIAHDMKTPLVAIGGYSQLIRKKLGEENPNSDNLDIIIKETEKLENMTKEMLDYSRPLQLKMNHGDLNNLVRENSITAKKIAEDRKVQLEFLLSDKLPKFNFDSVGMVRVFSNLVVNAIQASPEGETVTVRTYLIGNQVVLEVADHGSGIPSKTKKEIFSPFFTTKIYGTGLGLSIALKIVKAHGGSIDVLDNQGNGTIFKVILPFE